ncbi:MAG: MFS transporter [Chloroflexi bacterium]|nr:MFS transporter [Chloroflexota bacterium]
MHQPSNRGGPFFWLTRTFDSVRLRNYRLLWLGSLTEHGGEWMERIGIGWLVYELTGKAVMVGIVEFVRYIPFFILPVVGGVIADRADRKKLLAATFIAFIANATWLVMLVRTGRLEAWHIIVYSFLAGSIVSFNHPARNTLLPNLVPKEKLLNAISLDSASVAGVRVITAPLAGWLIAHVGVAWVLGLRGAGCVIALFWLWQLVAPATPGKARTESFWRNTMEGFRYTYESKPIFQLTILSLVPMMLIQPYLAMLPVFTKDILKGGPEMLGYLNGASGAGSLVALFFLASLGDYKHKGKLFFASFGVGGIALTALALLPWAPLSLFLVGVLGLGSSVFTALRTALLQGNVPDAVRGRVLSLREINQGFQPLGNLMGGAIADSWNAMLALAAMGIAGLVSAGATFARLPAVRRME